MSVSIVNGYVCFDCTDAAKAQKGIDPANPTGDPTQNKAEATKKAIALAEAKAAVDAVPRALLTAGLGLQVDRAA